MAIELNKRFALEGKAFDWTVVQYYEGVGRDGQPTIGEKRHHFPRLSQIATFIVNEEAKMASNLKELVRVIEQSTESIVARLGEAEARITASGLKAEEINVAQGEVAVSDEQKVEEAEPDNRKPRRRTRKKKAAG